MLFHGLWMTATCKGHSRCCWRRRISAEDYLLIGFGWFKPPGFIGFAQRLLGQLMRVLCESVHSKHPKVAELVSLPFLKLHPKKSFPLRSLNAQEPCAFGIPNSLVRELVVRQYISMHHLFTLSRPGLQQSLRRWIMPANSLSGNLQQITIAPSQPLSLRIMGDVTASPLATVKRCGD